MSLLQLHLGCGQRYLDGYLNVDFPDDAHTVQSGRRIDLEADLRALSFPPGSCAAVRSHHVFEHFTRVEALRLLLTWHDWLVTGGELVIETPDLAGSLHNLTPDKPPALRAKTIRHLFGSQEATWAAHLDAWDETRYRQSLPALGFEVDRVEHVVWQDLANVTVHARRVEKPFAERLAATEWLLRQALVDESSSELRLLEVWLGELRNGLRTATPSSSPVPLPSS